MKITNYIKSSFCLLFIVMVFSCKKENANASIADDFLKKADWFAKEKNYKNYAVYRSKFKEAYNNSIKRKKYEEAKLLLYHHENLLTKLYIGDSITNLYTKQFLNQNYPVKRDSTFILLHYLYAFDLMIGNNHKEAITWAKKALYYNQTLKNKDINRKIKNILGSCYGFTNQPKKALELYNEIIPILEKEKNYPSLGSLHYNIAYIYGTLNAKNEEKKFFKKAAYYFLKGKDSANYFALQSTFASIDFINTQDTIHTIKFIDSIKLQFRSYKKPTDLAVSCIDGAKALRSFLAKDHDSAFYYNNKSADYFRKSNNNFYLMFKDIFQIEVYFDKYKRLKDKQKTIKTLNDFMENEGYFESLQICNLLYQNAKSEKNISEALYYLDKEIALKDSILAENQKGQLFEFDKKYQSEKKEKEIAQQKSVISKNKLLISSLLIVLLTIVFGTVLYFFRKRKKEAQAETYRQEQFTFQLLQNTEEERSRIANELHDSVNHDLLNIKNNLINGKTIQVDEVANVIEEVRNISRNLHPAVLENIGLEVSIENLCERLTEIGLFTTCDIEYTQKLSKNKELQLYRIIQEALNNTLKHGKANAAIVF